MANMDLAKVLLDAGVQVVETPGCRTRRAPGAFAPIGVMNHHTAFGGTADAGSLKIVTDGRSDLPGPLCNILVGRRTGIAYLISYGRANDSGSGSGVVLNEVQRNIAPSGRASARGLVDTVNGNPYFYDIEIENNGLGEPYSAATLESVYRINAAICRFWGWHPNRCIAHKEWSRRKPDPNGIDMSRLRLETARRLAPLPKTPQEAIMSNYVYAELLPGITGPWPNGRWTFVAVTRDGRVDVMNDVSALGGKSAWHKGDCITQNIRLADNAKIVGFSFLYHADGRYRGYVLFGADGGTFTFI
jgi:hypothetical protein